MSKENSTVVEPILLDTTGQEMVTQLKAIAEVIKATAIGEYIKNITVTNNTLTILYVKNNEETTITYTPNLSGKVDKVTGTNIVYGKDGYGKEGTFAINVNENPYSIAYRDANGGLHVTAPQSNTHAVNKEFLEEQLAKIEIETVELTGTLEIPALTYSGTITSEQYEKLINNQHLLLTIQVNGSDYAKAFVNCRMYDLTTNLITSTCSFIDGENKETKYSLYIDGDSLTFKGGIIKTDLSDLTEEEWVFTLEDGTVVTKRVALWQ